MCSIAPPTVRFFAPYFFRQGLGRSLLQPPASDIALQLLEAMAETAATHGEVVARRSAVAGLTQLATDWLPQAQGDAAGAASGSPQQPGAPQQQAAQPQQPQQPPLPAAFAAGFASFAVEKLGAQATIAAPLRGDVDFADAAAMGLLLDLVNLQLLLTRRCGDAWTTYAAAVMQSAGCPPAAAEQYVGALKARAAPPLLQVLPCCIFLAHSANSKDSRM